MKFRYQFLILFVSTIVLMTLTSVPLKFAEWWVRLNGFEARGFSGSIFTGPTIDFFADQNSKRGIELHNLQLRYSLWPRLVIQKVQADKVQFYRNSLNQTHFTKKLPQLLDSLTQPLQLKNTKLQIDHIELKQIEYRMVEGSEPLHIDHLLISNLSIENGRLNVDRIDAAGERLKISSFDLHEQSNARGVFVEVSLPKMFFSDLKDDLGLKLLFDRANNMSLLSVEFWSLARLKRGAPPALDTLEEWSRQFIDRKDAEVAYTTLRDFYF